MSKIKGASTIVIMCLAMSNAWAKDAEEIVRPHGLEHMSEDTWDIPQHLWEIIGAYTATRPEAEKFIKPAKDCNIAKDLNNDYLLQLQLCKEQRKGWLKI
jgi:hypothetical protein